MIKTNMGSSLLVAALLSLGCASQSPLVSEVPRSEDLTQLINNEETDPATGLLFGNSITVSNGNDSGDGSLRAALEQASSAARTTTITIPNRINRIELQSPLVYSGTANLTLAGNGVILDASRAGGTALTISSGANLTLEDFTVVAAAGEGVKVENPECEGFRVAIQLSGINLVDNSGAGFLLEDTADCPLTVSVANSDFSENAGEGILIQEDGDGNLSLTLSNTTLNRNSRDGLLLEENDLESVNIRLTNVVAENNSISGMTFKEGDIGNLVVNGRNVSTSANATEGMSLAEEKEGNLIFQISGSESNRNRRNGYLLIEEGPGNLNANSLATNASENVISGFNLSQAAAGQGRFFRLGGEIVDNTNEAIKAENVEVTNLGGGF